MRAKDSGPHAPCKRRNRAGVALCYQTEDALERSGTERQQEKWQEGQAESQWQSYEQKQIVKPSVPRESVEHKPCDLADGDDEQQAQGHTAESDNACRGRASERQREGDRRQSLRQDGGLGQVGDQGRGHDGAQRHREVREAGCVRRLHECDTRQERRERGSDADERRRGREQWRHSFRMAGGHRAHAHVQGDGDKAREDQRPGQRHEQGDQALPSAQVGAQPEP